MKEICIHGLCVSDLYGGLWAEVRACEVQQAVSVEIRGKSRVQQVIEIIAQHAEPRAVAADTPIGIEYRVVHAPGCSDEVAQQINAPTAILVDSDDKVGCSVDDQVTVKQVISSFHLKGVVAIQSTRRAGCKCYSGDRRCARIRTRGRSSRDLRRRFRLFHAWSTTKKNRS